MLSKYCSNIANKYDKKIGAVNKVAPNLGNKSKYVLYYKNFQLYLPLGMKLVNLFKNVNFKQSHWSKKFIDFNTGKRKDAVNSF